MNASRSKLISLTAAALHRARLMGPLAVAAGYAGRNGTFQILSYHRVNDAGDPFFPSLPTAVFERQMRFLSRTYSVLTVEAVVERARAGRLPRNALAITFDDGYRDNLTQAAPILSRHGLPATAFVATGAIETGEPLWFDRLAAAFKHTTVVALKTPWGDAFELDSERARLQVLGQSLAYLKRQPEGAFERALEDLLDSLDRADGAHGKNVMLTWDDVRALAGRGFAIGAHTVSHPILSRVPPERAWREIAESRAMIAAACGDAPRAFAYPNGKADDYTTQTAELVRRAGFTCAVTTQFGLNTRDTSPWRLRRGGPWERDLATFALKLASTRLVGAGEEE